MTINSKSTSPIRVTQAGRAIPTVGDTLTIFVGAKGSAVSDFNECITQSFLVTRVGSEIALVSLEGITKGRATQTFNRIPQLVEFLDNNHYVVDWVVDGEEPEGLAFRRDFKDFINNWGKERVRVYAYTKTGAVIVESDNGHLGVVAMHTEYNLKEIGGINLLVQQATTAGVKMFLNM